MCGACERERASTMVQMYGQPYNQNTLKPVPPGETASLHRVCIYGSKNFHSIDLYKSFSLVVPLIMSYFFVMI